MALTKKQENFCQEYLIDANATQAAIRAGYSKKTASTVGSENLGKPDISERIGELQQKRIKRVEIDADDLLKQLHEMRISDFGDIIDDAGLFLPVKQWPLIWRQMVEGFEVIQSTNHDTGETTVKHKLKFVSRTTIQKMFGEHTRIAAFQKKEVHLHAHLHESVDRLGAGRARARIEREPTRQDDSIIDGESSEIVETPSNDRLSGALTRINED